MYKKEYILQCTKRSIIYNVQKGVYFTMYKKEYLLQCTKRSILYNVQKGVYFTMYKKEYILQCTKRSIFLQCTNDREGNVGGCQLIAKIQKEMLNTIKPEALEIFISGLTKKI